MNDIALIIGFPLEPTEVEKKVMAAIFNDPPPAPREGSVEDLCQFCHTKVSLSPASQAHREAGAVVACLICGVTAYHKSLEQGYKPITAAANKITPEEWTDER